MTLHFDTLRHQGTVWEDPGTGTLDPVKYDAPLSPEARESARVSVRFGASLQRVFEDCSRRPVRVTA